MAKSNVVNSLRKKSRKKLGRHTKHINKIGDTLLIISTTIAGLNLDHPHIAIIVQVTGIAGKFITNFFHYENETDNI